MDINTTISEVARFIMASSLSAEIQSPDLLQEWVDTSAYSYSRWLFLEFYRKIDDCYHAKAALLIKVRECGGGMDEDGKWKRYRVFTRVSWPSYGDFDTAIAHAKIQLMAEVCELAKAIEERFSESIRQIVQTKAEREAKAAITKKEWYHDGVYQKADGPLPERAWDYPSSNKE